jgi:hypothetical protein
MAGRDDLDGAVTDASDLIGAYVQFDLVNCCHECQTYAMICTHELLN